MADVSDLSDVYDSIFNFVVYRHHLIHFYLSFPEIRFEGEIFGPHENVLHQDPPTRHQIADLGVGIEGQRRLDREVDRLGHRILQDLRVTFRRLSSRARPGPASFKYCVYTMIVQHPKIFVPVSYVSPAMPLLTIYASVCKEWNRAISAVVECHNMLNFRHLWMCSQTRGIVSFWVHEPVTDRFRLHADLISELRLLIIRSPVQ